LVLPDRLVRRDRVAPGRADAGLAGEGTILYSIHMVHLNITLDEDLFRRLKQKAPSRKMSAFIAEALRGRLGPLPADLEAAYREASREPWRKPLAEDWSATETEAWPG
jgi:hypothetical protein